MYATGNSDLRQVMEAARSKKEEIEDKDEMNEDDEELGEEEEEEEEEDEGEKSSGGAIRSTKRERITRFEPYEKMKAEETDEHLANVSIKHILTASGENRVLKVSHISKPRSVAGGICIVTRAGDPPKLLATGPEAVNQAIKAVAQARGYLESENIDLCIVPQFREDRGKKMYLILSKKIGRFSTISREKEVDLSVARSSVMSKVAGAIAGKVRDGERVSLTSIGAESANNALTSVALARKYLADSKMDLKAVPSMVAVDKDGESKVAVKLTILAEQV